MPPEQTFFHIDLGQIIISTLIGLVGYFVKRTLDNLTVRLDKHDDTLIELIKNVSEINGERRKYPRM